MKKILILFMLILLVSCAKEDKIASTELEGKNVILSIHEFELEPDGSHDFYIGIKNNMSDDISLKLVLECKTSNCQDNLRVQTFPVIGLGFNKSGAFPIRVEALTDTEKGNYTYQIVLVQDESTYGEEEFTVEITKTMDEFFEK